jgi:hypothetical protein
MEFDIIDSFITYQDIHLILGNKNIQSNYIKISKTSLKKLMIEKNY